MASTSVLRSLGIAATIAPTAAVRQRCLDLALEYRALDDRVAQLLAEVEVGPAADRRQQPAPHGVPSTE